VRIDADRRDVESPVAHRLGMNRPNTSSPTTPTVATRASRAAARCGPELPRRQVDAADDALDLSKTGIGLDRRR
jgi:hypothetical protein